MHPPPVSASAHWRHLRCVYYGWKFDADGHCLEMPNIPADQDFRQKVKAHAYRVAEREGLAYVYMGEHEAPPPLPVLVV